MSLFSVLFRFRDKKSPDKLGLYPESFHLEAFPERRYLWTSRAFVVFSGLSFCLCLVLTAFLFLLLPQRTAGPSFYTFENNFSQLRKVQRESVSVSAKDLITENYITEYLKMRHSLPRSTADFYYRWNTDSKFYYYSGIRCYYDFVNAVDKDQMKEFIKRKMRRTVEIEDVQKLTSTLWRAQFKTKTFGRGLSQEDVSVWRAYLTIAYLDFDKYEDIENEESEKQNYLLNPFGFKVMRYSLAYAGKPEKSYTAQQSAKRAFEKLEDINQ